MTFEKQFNLMMFSFAENLKPKFDGYDFYIEYKIGSKWEFLGNSIQNLG